MMSSEEQLYNGDTHRQSDNDIEVDDCEDEDDANVSANMKQLANRNNMSGSYSNLFQAEKTDDESTEVIAGKSQIETDQVVGGLPRENVYSNVPFGSGPDLASSTLIQIPAGNRESALNDSSLHVYSNVASTVGVQATATLHDTSFGGISSIVSANTSSTPTTIDSLLQMRRFSGEGQSTSTLMADDLDLDDAVMGAGAFSQNNHRSVVSESNPSKSNAVTGQPPYFPKKMPAVSIELTNVMPQVKLIYQNVFAISYFVSIIGYYFW